MMWGIRRGGLISVVLAVMVAGASNAPVYAAVGADLRPGAEAAFVQLDPIDYEFVVRKGGEDITVPFTTTTSRLFYTLQPAEVNAETAPLFVFLNGGPGAATTANFFANNTAPYTLNRAAVGNDPAGVVKNPNSWTTIANLLYIDPSQSGFSYSVSDQVFADPEYGSILQQLWQEYWARGNLNPFIDADQILRVILTFLKTHPEFANREVVMVGESYGGVRVSTILHLLMNSGIYDERGSSFFHDPELAALIREHFGSGQYPPTAEAVSEQFDRQILVQPQLSSYQDDEQGKLYWDKKDSIIDQVAEAANSHHGFTRSWVRCAAHIPPMMSKSTCPTMVYLPQFNRDRYDYAMPADYSDKQDAYTNKSMRNVSILRTMLGVEPSAIKGLPKAERGSAYHTMGLPAVGDDERPTNDKNTLAGLFATLDAPDSYYVAWNQYAYLAATQNFGSYTRDNLPLSADKSPLYGTMFLQNLRHVQTFLTDAKRDLVIFSEALPKALGRYSDVVKDVTATEQTPAAQGRVVVTWKDSTSTAITWPIYEKAGHAVAMTMADKLLGDVASWMSGSGEAQRYVSWNVRQAKLQGIRVTMSQPAAKSGSRWLFSVRSARGKAVNADGVMRWRVGKQVVVVKGLSLHPAMVRAQVGGKRVVLLRRQGASVQLAASGARMLRRELKVPTLRAGLPMGRLVVRK